MVSFEVAYLFEVCM